MASEPPSPPLFTTAQPASALPTPDNAAAAPAVRRSASRRVSPARGSLKIARVSWAPMISSQSPLDSDD
jgi:hypothetical protein